ncbi:uncharacterized protein TNCV_1815141 [Trichonephila clavipes]|nr:uncharacterized protein TNCV_1815141 [Trichonephila clavipes]
MPVCHRWVQEETMNRGGPSRPPRCTTAIEDKRTMCMAVMDHAAAFRTTAQQIQSFMHHSVSACTIRRRLQQSGASTRDPLLRLPLTGNNHQCSDGHGQRNGTTTACNITMVGFEIGETVLKGY